MGALTSSSILPALIARPGGMGGGGEGAGEGGGGVGDGEGGGGDGEADGGGEGT